MGTISGSEIFNDSLQSPNSLSDGEMGERTVEDLTGVEGASLAAAGAAIDAASQSSQSFSSRSSSPMPVSSPTAAASAVSSPLAARLISEGSEFPEEMDEAQARVAIDQKRAESAKQLGQIVSSDQWGLGKKVKVDLTPLVQEMRERAKDTQQIMDQVERDIHGMGTCISITTPKGGGDFGFASVSSAKDEHAVAQELLGSLKTAIRTTYVITSTFGKDKERSPDEINMLAHQALTFATQKGEQAISEQVCARLQKIDPDVASTAKIHRELKTNIAVTKDGITVSGKKLGFMMVVPRDGKVVYDHRLDVESYEWHVAGKGENQILGVLRPAMQKFIVPKS